jgi:hypothetical protein
MCFADIDGCAEAAQEQHMADICDPSSTSNVFEPLIACEDAKGPYAGYKCKCKDSYTWDFDTLTCAGGYLA